MADQDIVTEGEEENGGLLFAWQKKPALFLYLVAFVGGSLLLHLFGFYLFQVVYPAAGRLEPEPARVTLLDASQPSVSALLRKIEDRLVYLRPASDGSEVRVSLGDYSAQFESTISSHRPAFRTPAPVAAIRGSHAAAIADPLGPNRRAMPAAVLPPVDSVAKSAAASPPDAAGKDSEKRWKISGDLKGRAQVDAADFEAALPALGVPPAIRFRIAVGPNGGIVSHLPVSGQGHPRFTAVSGAIRSALRFEPKPDAELEWGWLEIRR